MRNLVYGFRVFVLCFGLQVFGLQQNATAQLMYFAGQNSHLYEFNATTLAVQDQGLISTPNGSTYLMDIACSPTGELYAIDGPSRLLHINRHTAVATVIGYVGAAGTGLSFTPDGRLWTIGSPGQSGSTAMYTVDLQTAHPTWMYDVGALPAGDLGFNRKDQQWYMSSNGGAGTVMLRINSAAGMNLGTVNQVGLFGIPNSWGFDFLGNQFGNGHSLIAAGSIGEMVRLDKSGNTWNSTVLPSVIPSGVTGATKYHCQAQSAFTINGVSASVVERHCGEPIVVDGSASGSVLRYQWKISGQNATGQEVQVQIPESGAGQAGNPGVLNLQTDPRFSVFQLNQNPKLGQVLNIELTIWCDLYEDPAVMTSQVIVRPYAFDWSISPDQTEFEVNKKTTFSSLAAESMVSQEWQLDAAVISNQSAFERNWAYPEVGPHTMTYRVVHENGCVSESSRSFTVFQNDLFFPTAFSPNGDGLNDVYKPVINEQNTVQTFDFRVFNRWGNLVYQSSNISTAAWDGQMGSVDAPSGQYLYSLQIQIDGKSTIHNGSFTLIR
jgi:gliding motility-associated-like protein